MSLNRYHNSRASDNVFKLLHEESSYLDILKGNVRSAYSDEIGEDSEVTHDSIRQELLHEQALLNEEDPGIAAVDDAETENKPEDDEGTPKQQADAAEEAGREVKEDIDQLIEDELKEISIAVARQGAARMAQKKGLAARGLLRAKNPARRMAAPKKKVMMGRL